MRLFGIEITMVRDTPKAEPFNPWRALAAPAPSVVPPTVAPPRTGGRINRGILSQIIIPEIDESNALDQLVRNKFMSELGEWLTKRKCFSVCAVDDFVQHFGIAATPDTVLSSRVLRKMHCVDFDLVPPSLHQALPHLVNHVISGGEVEHECLGLRRTMVDV